MSRDSIPRAARFRDAFLQSYGRCRIAFKTPRAWDEVWPRWNELMMAQLISSAALMPAKRSVLARTAHALGLSYWQGQPLTVDAVFSWKGAWFPISAAIEHENDWRGFEAEVMKLFSIRCPLKVGITYARDSKIEACSKWLVSVLEGDFRDAVSRIGAEPPATEYLFLIGGESEDKDISCWYSLVFRAGDGPHGGTFVQLRARS